MVRYMKCPRCELNYIDAEKQSYCDICLLEMKGIAIDGDDIEDTDEELATELCPICNENMIRPGEKMCDECRKKSDFEEEPNPDEDDEWREYLDDDTDSELDDEIDESIKEEFDEADMEEEEEFVEEEEEEDLEYVTGDEIYSIPDDEDDDEDGDEDDF